MVHKENNNKNKILSEPKKLSELLKSRIIWLDLLPEQVVNLTEVAETYSVSRTPVKEALILLQAEEWVVSQGTHFVVTPLTLERLKQITEIRVVLEIQGNVWAMERIIGEELEQLYKVKAEMGRIHPDVNKRQVVELDYRFHQILYQAAKNERLAKLLEQLLGHYLRYQLEIPLGVDTRNPFEDQLNMIQAIENKDQTKLSTLSASHIQGSVDNIIHSLFQRTGLLKRVQN